MKWRNVIPIFSPYMLKYLLISIVIYSRYYEVMKSWKIDRIMEYTFPFDNRNVFMNGILHENATDTERIMGSKGWNK